MPKFVHFVRSSYKVRTFCTNFLERRSTIISLMYNSLASLNTRLEGKFCFSENSPKYIITLYVVGLYVFQKSTFYPPNFRQMPGYNCGESYRSAYLNHGYLNGIFGRAHWTVNLAWPFPVNASLNVFAWNEFYCLTLWIFPLKHFSMDLGLRIWEMVFK